MCGILDGWSWSLIFWYAQGALPILIAIAVAYVAYQQYWTNKLRAKLDLFDRRMRVFLEVRRVLSSVNKEGRADMAEFLKFRTGIPESYFLFGEEIEKYIDEIYEHGRKLVHTDNMARIPVEDRSGDYDPKKNANEQAMHLGWLMDEQPRAKTRFKRYMDVSDL